MLFDHKANLYTKDNLIITIAGKIKNKEAIIKQLEQEFKNIPETKRSKRPDFTEMLPTEST